MHEIWFVHDTQASPVLRRTALERAGWSVRATSRADEALAWLRSGTPTLLMVDVLIEGRTGFELCRAIRAEHPADRLPIVLGCHVYQDPEHAAEAERVGAQRYVALPIEPENLLSIVAELTGAEHGVRAA